MLKILSKRKQRGNKGENFTRHPISKINRKKKFLENKKTLSNRNNY